MYPREQSANPHPAAAAYNVEHTPFYPPYPCNQAERYDFQPQPHLQLRTDFPPQSDSPFPSAASISPQTPATFPVVPSQQPMFEVSPQDSSMAVWQTSSQPQASPVPEATPMWTQSPEYAYFQEQQTPSYPQFSLSENRGSHQESGSYPEHGHQDTAAYQQTTTFPYPTTNGPRSAVDNVAPVFHEQQRVEEERRPRYDVFEEPLRPEICATQIQEAMEQEQSYRGYGQAEPVAFEQQQMQAGEGRAYDMEQQQLYHDQSHPTYYQTPHEPSYEQVYNEQHWQAQVPQEEPPMEALRPDPPLLSPTATAPWAQMQGHAKPPAAPPPVPHTLTPFAPRPSVTIINPYAPVPTHAKPKEEPAQPPRRAESNPPTAATQNTPVSSGSAPVVPSQVPKSKPASPSRPAAIKSESDNTASNKAGPSSSEESPVVPSQSHVGPPRLPKRRETAFRPFHPYPAHQRTTSPNNNSSGCETSAPPIIGLFGSYPLSLSQGDMPLPGPTCAPETSSSVMRLVLTPAVKRPGLNTLTGSIPTAPPPVKRPRMACFFCRKRKIACGPGPQAQGQGKEGDGEASDDSVNGDGSSPEAGGASGSSGGSEANGSKNANEDEGPCNQCARRGLTCTRPTESRRGVRKGRGRDAESSANGEATATLELAPRRMKNSNEDSNDAQEDDAMEDVEEAGDEDVKPNMPIES